MVDSGAVKIKQYDSKSRMESLKVVAVSQSQANQRAGRAGRESKGICFRLYTEEAFNSLPRDAVPEIARVDLAQVVMQLLALNVHRIQEFEFLQKPSNETLLDALMELDNLGACIKLDAVKVCRIR